MSDRADAVYRRSRSRRVASGRGRRPGFSFLEVVIAAASGTILMIGLGSTLFLLTRSASGTAAGEQRFRLRSRLSQMEREIVEARSIRMPNESELRLEMPSFGRELPDVISYRWDDDLASLVRRQGESERRWIEGLSDFEFTPTTVAGPADDLPCTTVRPAATTIDLSGSQSTLNVSFGQIISQPLALPTAPEQSGAILTGHLIDLIRIRLSNRSHDGTIELRIVRADAAGNPAEDPIYRTTIAESSLTGNEIEIRPEHAVLLHAGSNWLLQLRPLDEDGDFKLHQLIGSPLASSMDQTTRVATPLTRAIRLTLSTRSLERRPLDGVAPQLLTSIGYELSTDGPLSDSLGGQVAIVSRQPRRDSTWRFSGNDATAPIDDVDADLQNWELSGTLADPIDGTRRLTGKLSTAPNSAASGPLRARVRFGATSGSGDVDCRIGIGDPSDDGFELQALWVRPISGDAELRFALVKGLASIPLSRRSLVAGQGIDFGLTAVPIEGRIELSIDDVPVASYDVDECGIRANQAIGEPTCGLSIDTGSATIPIDLLVLEQGAGE